MITATINPAPVTIALTAHPDAGVPAMTDDEREMLAGLSPEGQAEGLALFRDPNPRVRQVARMMSVASPELLEPYRLTLELPREQLPAVITYLEGKSTDKVM